MPRGTIFLDEIGDMTPATQTKILRVLQIGTFERVGGNQPIRVDVRVIAATNKPLGTGGGRAREFREDLFYRLNVVRIHMPPLRERREDIRCWSNYFLKKHAAGTEAATPKSIRPEVLALLEHYHWPGNVRELENVIQRALVVAKGDAILPQRPAAGIWFRRTPDPRRRVHTVPSPASSRAGARRRARPTCRRWLAACSDGRAQDEPSKVIPAVERELVVKPCGNPGQPGAGRQAARDHPRHAAQAHREVQDQAGAGRRVSLGRNSVSQLGASRWGDEVALEFPSPAAGLDWESSGKQKGRPQGRPVLKALAPRPTQTQ